MDKFFAFFRLFRFKCLYSDGNSNLVRGLCCLLFLWAVWCLCADVGGWGGSCGGVLPILGLLVSFLTLLKDIREFAVQFHSQEDMDCFKDRDLSSKQALIEMWKKITKDKTGFTVHSLERGSEFLDFVSYSDDLNRRFVDGFQLSFTVKAFRRTNCWNQIHSELSEALKVLALKLKNSRCHDQDFSNESKVVLVSEFRVVLDNAKRGEPEAQIDIAKSCYYASYLTNESYRDFCYDGMNKGHRLHYRGDWTPGGAEDSVCLPDFTAAKSFHVGVNTLGITRDGWICLWIQNKGQRSNNLMAPTGSGSMDWADIRHAKGCSFNSVVIHAAERELQEESFDNATRKRLRETQTPLASRITGMYRWGALGGLPGFALVTLIPLNHDDVHLPPKRGHGGNGEVVMDSEKIHLDVLPDMILDGDAAGDFCQWREKCIKAVLEFRREREASLSVPLDVCFSFFVDALRTNEKFGKWIHSFLECTEQKGARAQS